MIGTTDMNTPSSASALAAMALAAMGLICTALIFHAVPQGNQQLVTFALGAISGALTVTGGSKIADKITTSTGANPTIQSDAPHPQSKDTPT